jgi:hypothetical protein
MTDLWLHTCSLLRRSTPKLGLSSELSRDAAEAALAPPDEHRRLPSSFSLLVGPHSEVDAAAVSKWLTGTDPLASRARRDERTMARGGVGTQSSPG